MNMRKNNYRTIPATNNLPISNVLLTFFFIYEGSSTPCCGHFEMVEKEFQMEGKKIYRQIFDQ